MWQNLRVIGQSANYIDKSYALRLVFHFRGYVLVITKWEIELTLTKSCVTCSLESFKDKLNIIVTNDEANFTDAVRPNAFFIFNIKSLQ